MFLHVRCWNLTRNMHNVISANAVGILINMLRLETCAIFILNTIANIKINPSISFLLMVSRKKRDSRFQDLKLTHLCQWLLDRSIKIGCILFYLAILLIMVKASNLSQGYMYTADQLSRLTRIESTKAGNAHKTLRFIRLSNLDVIDDDKLRTSGPTKRQANKSKHVLFLDFSIFCSKNSTNWMTSEGKQCMDAIMQPNTFKYVASVMAQITTPKVNILQEILIAVLRPLRSANRPYIIKPIKERVYGNTYINQQIPSMSPASDLTSKTVEKHQLGFFLAQYGPGLCPGIWSRLHYCSCNHLRGST